MVQYANKRITFSIAMLAHQLKYMAHHLTGSNQRTQRLIAPLVLSRVEIKPHQINAVLFALHDPKSKGVILADEVGLGKTIEAGLLLTYFWIRKKRKLLVICPASLRMQWSAELAEKFGLRNTVLTRSTYYDGVFDANRVIIISYDFAVRLSDELANIDWDLCVLDEAHKLRNVYKPESVQANTLRSALQDRKKVLLTATPLQNDLMELYGLFSVIDNEIFSSETAFRRRYSNANLKHLTKRIAPFLYRTLRANVAEYINYTDRKATIIEFKPTDVEIQLHDLTWDFILRKDILSISKPQRKLILTSVCKLLGSSSVALVGILTKLRKGLLSKYKDREDLVEIPEIDQLITLANSIGIDTKTKELIKILETTFAQMRTLGANEKVVIFTGYVRTQKYLQTILEEHYPRQIVLFNGKNDDKMSHTIYKEWRKNNNKGDKSMTIRTAITEYFRDHAKIMIATEAASEGLNLQFCSVVVNYDLPWNPQRIEQRTGRCHRYGQKFDVMVINLMNTTNLIDKRLHYILHEKIKLFNGIFGASDEILSTVGKRFEKDIQEIVSTCRTREEIEEKFAALQQRMSASIERNTKRARNIVNKYFCPPNSRGSLDFERQQQRYLEYLWQLAKSLLQECDSYAAHTFCESSHTFLREWTQFSTHKTRSATYYLSLKEHITLTKNDRPFSPFSQLGKRVVTIAKRLATEPAHIMFSNVMNKKIKSRGWIMLAEITVNKKDKELGVAMCDATGKLQDRSLVDELLCSDAEISGGILHDYPATLASGIDNELASYSNKYQDMYKQWHEEYAEKAENLYNDIKVDFKAKVDGTQQEVKYIKQRLRQTYNTSDKFKLQGKLRGAEGILKTVKTEYNSKLEQAQRQRDESLERIERLNMPPQMKKRTLFVISYEITTNS